MLSIVKREKVINQVLSIPIENIKPNPNQPRVFFDENKLIQLASSIEQNGILQPITVRKLSYNNYEIISGERRYRAAKLVNLCEVPCILMDKSDEDSTILAIIENLQRDDLHFFEEAKAIHNLISHFGLTQETASLKLGKAQSTIANKLRLLNLTDEEQQLIELKGLTERQSRELLRIKDSNLKKIAIEKIAETPMNTKETEAFINNLLNPSPTPRGKLWAFKEQLLYINSIKKVIKEMKRVGISHDFHMISGEDCIEFNIKIYK